MRCFIVFRNKMNGIFVYLFCIECVKVGRTQLQHEALFRCRKLIYKVKKNHWFFRLRLEM